MDQSMFEWIERLGGWAAVLLVVRWMMSRFDRMIDSQDRAVAAMKSAIDAFQRFQSIEEETHARLIETQREILDQIRELKPSHTQ
jgi:hypothetical protein